MDVHIHEKKTKKPNKQSILCLVPRTDVFLYMSFEVSFLALTLLLDRVGILRGDHMRSGWR